MATTARGSIDGRCPSCCLFWPACICRRRHPPPLCTPPTTSATLPQKPPGSFLLFTFDRRVTAGSTTKIPREKKSQGKRQSHSPLHPSKLSKSGYHIIGITNQTPIATLAENPITYRHFFSAQIPCLSIVGYHIPDENRYSTKHRKSWVGVCARPFSIQLAPGHFSRPPNSSPQSSEAPAVSRSNQQPTITPSGRCPPAGQGRPSHHFPGPGSFF